MAGNSEKRNRACKIQKGKIRHNISVPNTCGKRRYCNRLKDVLHNGIDCRGTS